MKAIVDANKETTLMEIEANTPTGHEVEVKILYAGLNRRDLMIRLRRGDETAPIALGSDGVGIVTRVGEAVTRFNIGETVIVNPGLHWQDCTIASPDTLEIVGYPHHGTFRDYYIQDETYFERKPAHLTNVEASVLALSALTAYRAVFTKGQLKSDETIFIPGGSSGVSTYIITFAKAIGARVLTTSRDKDKLANLKALGADVTLLTDDDWEEALQNETIDCVIDSIGQKTFDRSLAVLKKGGRLVTFGATTDDVVSFNVRQFFYNQQTILGSTMGSREELRAMLAFIEDKRIHPIVDTIFNYTEYDEAFNYIKESKQLGKIALKFNHD
ncbi:zinc-binding alcohol dehydrogenase/oxidoreductase [Halolactibacillus halophilus]|uniref:Alcohol dehydrogenase n=1 Tax=Halolactibacillus halophilus TaxID=306540 RepID=A0A1I5N847_9BACI|nr:zinc-binding dehydrogenase [Halolactibacillus halophilus]GEM01197.1 alcohol dehydrogenase [Halolactibacillus halophilus]SFP17880.1 zinc-binding alcohol dehydrogenase/oxidoreductase [Halolactibacillus halophilus]